MAAGRVAGVIAPLLGLASAALVVVAALHHRPPPRRVRALRQAPAPSPRRAPLERVGELVWVRVARRPPPAAATSRRTGAAVAGVAVGLALWPPLGPVLGLAAWSLVAAGERSGRRRRETALHAELPEVVDLFVVAVGAGLTVPLAVEAVGRRAAGALGPELRRVAGEARLGRRVSDALDALVGRVGDPVRPLVSALTDSDRYGAPLAASLERLAAEARLARRRRAEEAARRVPVKLLFPLVACVLPAFALLTVAPLIAGAVRALRL